MGKESHVALKAFVKGNLKTSDNYREILIICSCFLDGEVVAHAGTFLRQEYSSGAFSIKYYDPNENHLYEKGDHKIDYPRLFSRFGLITVYSLQGRQVEIKEKKKIDNKMTRIMTGKISAKIVKDVKERE